jgi:hypothetical protein
MPFKCRSNVVQNNVAKNNVQKTKQFRLQTSAAWGWDQDSDGSCDTPHPLSGCGWDLKTASTFKHFSHFIDNFRVDVVAKGGAAAVKLQELEAKMRVR